MHTVATSHTVVDADVVIIGAGPVGLFQVFELGLLGIHAHVVESLDRPGGQCTELYPDKPIYDIPALPSIGAQQMIDNLLVQIEPFEPTFHFNQQIISVQKLDNNRFELHSDKGTVFITKAVVIAAGVGSFEPVRLKLDGVNQHVGSQVFYSVKQPELHRDKEIVILGGGDSALDWALTLKDIASSVLLVHRSEHFRAATASVNRMRKLCDNFEMQFMTGNVTGLVENSDAGSLNALEITSPDGLTRRIELDHLLVFFGLSPKLGPLQDWNLELRKKQLVVDTERFESSMPGVYAIGDINWYPGKKKLILSGFHEAALAAFAIKEQLNPDEKVSLQYTTTSSKMHQRLGVDDPYRDEAAA